jgi:hypothetical protein
VLSKTLNQIFRIHSFFFPPSETVAVKNMRGFFLRRSETALIVILQLLRTSTVCQTCGHLVCTIWYCFGIEAFQGVRIGVECVGDDYESECSGETIVINHVDDI